MNIGAMTSKHIPWDHLERGNLTMKAPREKQRLEVDTDLKK